jgi:alanyl-tRNA synthetase
MTHRLYYRDSALRQFDATVVSSSPAQGNGAGFWVLLDRTAFYPTSGGQPHDTGSLGDAKVTDVFEDVDNAIIHVTEHSLALGPIRGSIDFGRRFDHMQQHSGSHLVSAAFLELYGIPTISFHLGHETSTIDLAAGSLSQEQIQTVERRCNDIIRENLSVTARIEDSVDLAAALPNHRSPSNKILRVIEIEGWDAQPCGGTHVESTGQIGLVLLRRLVKAKGNCRLEFVCGGRAARMAQDDFAVMQEATRQLSCTFASLPAAISSLVAERNSYLRACEHSNKDSAELQADLLIARQPRSGTRPSAIVHIFENRDFEYLKLVAFRLIESPDTVALLGSRRKGEVLFAQAAGLPTDMCALFRSVVLPAKGKGGGTRELAQGMVPDPKNLEILLGQACERLQHRLALNLPRLRKAHHTGFGKLTGSAALGD